MKLEPKTPELAVDTDDPFANDKLNRRPAADTLTQFVQSLSGPFVLAIGSPWGTGKTTFLRMWRASLTSAGIPSLYFNAWHADYAADPFSSLVGELGEAVSELTSGSKARATIQKSFQKTKKIAVAISKRALPAAAKLATAGMLDLKELSEVIGDTVKDLTADQVQSYRATKNSTVKFRESLAKLTQQLQKEAGGPLVIFVDEMDRCRPTYAIELLERVKHLFDVRGIVFVLAIDKEQLSESIRSVYGGNFDATGYLRRFIDMDYRLPLPENQEYCAYLFEDRGINTFFKNSREHGAGDREALEFVVGALATFGNLTLRELQHVCGKLVVALHMVRRQQPVFPAVLGFLTFLKDWRPNFYDQLVQGNANVEEMWQSLLPDVVDSRDKRQEVVAGILLYLAAHFGISSERLANFRSAVAPKDEDEDDVSDDDHYIANRVMSVFENVRSEARGGEGVDITVERVEMTIGFAEFGP